MAKIRVRVTDENEDWLASKGKKKPKDKKDKPVKKSAEVIALQNAILVKNVVARTSSE